MSKIINVKGLDFTKAIKPQQNQPQHNPFSVSFKGNELKADVFEFSAKKENINQANFVSKLADHCVNIKQQMLKPLQPAISFAGQVKQNAVNAKNNVVNTYNKLNSIQLNKQTFTAAINKVQEFQQNMNINKEVRVLMNKPVNELSDMFKAELQGIQA